MSMLQVTKGDVAGVSKRLHDGYSQSTTTAFCFLSRPSSSEAEDMLFTAMLWVILLAISLVGS